MTDCTPDDCVPIEPFPRLATSGAFVSRDPDTSRLRVRYFHRTTDDAIVATVWFGPGTEGPPGHAHGGSVAAVLDEAMGAAAWHAGHPVVAARLTVDFRQMVPVNVAAIAEARVERIDGRKVRTRGRLVSGSGLVFAESHGLFIILEDEQLQRLAVDMR
ncbi:MAG: PaaI family thioesterase [Bacteroidales bacterium]